MSKVIAIVEPVWNVVRLPLGIRIGELFELRVGDEAAIDIEAVHCDPVFWNLVLKELGAIDAEGSLKLWDLASVNAYLQGSAGYERHKTIGIRSSECFHRRQLWRTVRIVSALPHYLQS
jgi:hypothetical protein